MRYVTHCVAEDIAMFIPLSIAEPGFVAVALYDINSFHNSSNSWSEGSSLSQHGELGMR